MQWRSIEVRVPEASADAVGNFLMECGSTGLAFQEHGGITAVIGYFASDDPSPDIATYCASLGLEGTTIAVDMLDSEDWAENWKQHSTAQEVGQRLWIAPSWCDPAPPDRIAIRIDPGMAFGTGQHATTRSCLELIETAVEKNQANAAIDVGTGSGLLAIVLAKLGVREVVAIDNDPTACDVALENIRINQCEGSIRVTADWPDRDGGFDIVVANLFADVLEDLAGKLSRLCRRPGTIIVSGFLEQDRARVARAFHDFGFEPERALDIDGWTTLALAPRPT